MGGATAPVEGSGEFPTWIARVAKPGCFFMMILIVRLLSVLAQNFLWAAGTELPVEMKYVLRQIPLSGVGNDRGNPFPGTQLLRDFDGDENICSSARTGQNSFDGGQLLHHVKSIAVAHGNDLVRQRSVERL